jgi:hypothetical protein
MEKLKHLSKQLLAAKKEAQGAFLKSILNKEGKCWSDFYKYVKRPKENKDNISAIKDGDGRIVTDPTEKANLINLYYSSIFSSEDNIPHVQRENTSDPFTIDIKAIRRRIRAVGRKKSVGPDRIPGEILKVGEEAMIPYLVRLLEINMNNGALPGDWRRATVVPVHKGGDRSLVTNYRLVSLTSVVCKQIALYLRQEWEKMTGCTKGSTVLGRDIRVKVK